MGCDCRDDTPLTLPELVAEVRANKLDIASDEFRRELKRAIKNGDVSAALILVDRLEWPRNWSDGANEYKRWLGEKRKLEQEKRQREHWVEVGTWVI